MPTAPNVPLYEKQWALKRIGVEDVWNDVPMNRGGPVKVAIVDWGMQLGHQDFQRDHLDCVRVIPVAEAPIRGDFPDEKGHGTMLAGIIGAANNSFGVSGVVPEAHLLAVKFVDSKTPHLAKNAAIAIDLAVEYDAKVVNASWNVLDDADLRAVIERAGRAGVLIVAAAGNAGGNNDRVRSYPAAYAKEFDNVVSVMASNENDRKPGFSNFGPTSVDIAAPGTRIVTTSPYRVRPTTASPQLAYNSGYQVINGTSAAAAFVSGAAAMLLASDPTLTPLEIRKRLIATADTGPALKGLCVAGGRLNVHKAICRPLISWGPLVQKVIHSRTDSVSIAWGLRYKSPDVKTIDILLVTQDGREHVLVPELSVSMTPAPTDLKTPEMCPVTLPYSANKAVIRVRCREVPNFFEDSPPFDIA